MVDHLIERCKKPVLTALQDAGLKPNQIDEVVMVGGMTRMPRVQQLVKEIFGKEGHQGRQPGRGGRHRRRHPGGAAAPRVEVRAAAARRDPAVAGHRDARRGDDGADPEEHHDPDQEVADVHHGRRQPAVGRGAGVPGRAADGPGQQADRPVPPGRHPAGPAGDAADRGDVRPGRQRHPERLRQGPRHRQGEARSASSSSSGLSQGRGRAR